MSRMSYDDFVRNFEKLEICNLGPEVMAEVEAMTGVQVAKTAWQTRVHDSQWIANRTAGGCRNFISKPSFAISTRFRDSKSCFEFRNICQQSTIPNYAERRRSERRR